MSGEIPARMSALVLERYVPQVEEAIRGLQLQQRPVPEAGRGQVLVRIEAAPCNLSDLLFIQGLYGVNKTLPSVPGWEGAGTVVASGGGWMARRLVGKRVACGGQADRDGTWAEYYVTEAMSCVPLRRTITIDQGASLLINPLTALGLFDKARRGRHPAAVQSGAASQLGRMLLRLTLDAGLPLINVVRREDQAELLRSLGAEYVLDSTASDFDDRLREMCESLGATIAFDAVAGEMTGRLLGAMPNGSRVVVYGALSESACAAIDPIALIFRDKGVEGFYLGSWMRRIGMLRTLQAVSRVQGLVAGGAFVTTVKRRAGLDGAVEGLLRYAASMTEGKLLICP